MAWTRVGVFISALSTEVDVALWIAAVRQPILRAVALFGLVVHSRYIGWHVHCAPQSASAARAAA